MGLTLRDVLASLFIGLTTGALIWAAQVWWRVSRLPVPPRPDHLGDEVYRVLDEARRITVQAAREAGY
jgi:hypothetical protein